MAYSVVPDLLLGNVPLPTGTNQVKAQNAVDRAADEIDMTLGFMYETPIRATGPNQRAVSLLMRNINNWLASGRLIEELTASTQRTEIHAYAQSLINQALVTLQKIVTGDIQLPGVPGNGTDQPLTFGPVISNKDDSSNVDDFYDKVAPPPTYPSALSWPPPGVYVYDGGYFG